MAPCPYRVQHVKRETNDTFTLELSQVSGPRPVPFQPGQFNMLYVFGVGEVPISISGNTDTPETLVHTLRDVGMVTSAMAALKPGQMIGVRGPFGSAWPADRADGCDVVIVAGGIGLAPLRPLIYQIMGRRERYGRVVLLYGTRTPEEILFRKELEQWRARFDTDVFVTVDRATGRWRGHVGLVTKLIERAPFDPYRSIAFVCGPELMMTHTLESLAKRGLDPDQMYMSMERNMKCAIGLCGHCQFGPHFLCKNGPVFTYEQMAPLIALREV